MRKNANKSILIISQVFVPDPAAVGQHMADVSFELAARGWEVKVLTAQRGYDDPSKIYPASEEIQGAKIKRLPFSSFGKRSILIRIFAQVSFLLQVIIHGLFVKNLSSILISTSPPMVGFAALIISGLRRVPISYWVMDINPDQVIALKALSEKSVLVLGLKRLNRLVLAWSNHLVVLDNYMCERLIAKGAKLKKITVIPPWPHDNFLSEISHSENPFRAAHSIQEKFVVMYSGNISIASPLDSLLDAARSLAGDPTIVFMIIGGGLAKKSVETFVSEHQLENIKVLPYQPLQTLKYSLSAADLHVVTLGPSMVGVIHPCKVYGAMAVGRPVLFLGPRPSHVSDLLDRFNFGWHVQDSKHQNIASLIKQISQMPLSIRNERGQNGKKAVSSEFSKSYLCSKFVDVITAKPDIDRGKVRN